MDLSDKFSRGKNQLIGTLQDSFKILLQLAVTVISAALLIWVLNFFVDWILSLAIGILLGYVVWQVLDRLLWLRDPHRLDTSHPEVEYELVAGGKLLTEAEIESKQKALEKSGRTFRAGGFIIPEEDEVKGFAYVGAPGSGKTLNIRLHMQAALAGVGKGSDHRALIFDAKGDMPQILSGMGFGIDGPSSLVRILHPYDTRSCRWAMHRDITDLKTVNEIVPLFIPSGNSKDPIWEQLGRALLEGVFQTFILSGKPWTLRDVCNAMRSIERMQALFGLSVKTEGLIGKLLEGGKTTKSIEMTIYAYMKPFEFIAAVWEHASEEVSLTEWLNHQSLILVLGLDGASGSALERLNQVIVTRLSQLIFQQHNSDTRRTWLYFDELRQAGFFRLTPFATFGRSRGVGLVIGFQDMEGLESEYKEKDARELLGMCQNKAIFALSTSGTAEWASGQFGKQQYLFRPTNNNGTQQSTGEQIQEQPVVRPDAFLYMEPFSKGSPHVGYYQTRVIGSYCRALSPEFFTPPWLKPLDRSVECLAVRGRTLREGRALELSDWTMEEKLKWGLPMEEAKEAAATEPDEKRATAVTPPDEELPRLFRKRRK